ncbi:MAG: sugar phosphate isomerase/epimerase [Proteobacteria bacterium]|nr:sugar phosphate isomerase/epimerase [Pseudomonadota bacterium]
MNFGLATFFFVKKHILDVVYDIIAADIKTIELSCEMPHILDMNDNFVSRMNEFTRSGIEFSIHAPFFEVNLGSFYDDYRKNAIRMLKQTIDIAYGIGCDPVVIHPGYTMLTGRSKSIEETTRNYFIEDLHEIYSYAAERDLRVAIENVHLPFFFLCDPGDFKELHKKIPDIGLTLDIGHAYITKISNGVKDPEGAILQDIKDIGIEHLFHVHIHNNWGTKDNHLFYNGNTNLKRIIHGLVELGYTGKLIIESYEIEEMGINTALEKLKEIS